MDAHRVPESSRRGTEYSSKKGATCIISALHAEQLVETSVILTLFLFKYFPDLLQTLARMQKSST